MLQIYELFCKFGSLLLVETEIDLMRGTCLAHTWKWLECLLLRLFLVALPATGFSYISAQIRFSFYVLEENIKPLTGACHWAGRRTWRNSSYLHRPSSSLQSFMAFSGFLASDVGQSSGWDSHSVNANHKVFGLFLPLFDFGDKDDKILT